MRLLPGDPGQAEEDRFRRQEGCFLSFSEYAGFDPGETTLAGVCSKRPGRGSFLLAGERAEPLEGNIWSPRVLELVFWAIRILGLILL